MHKHRLASLHRAISTHHWHDASLTRCKALTGVNQRYRRALGRCHKRCWNGVVVIELYRICVLIQSIPIQKLDGRDPDSPMVKIDRVHLDEPLVASVTDHVIVLDSNFD
jgi:hypothetical protein